MKQRVAAVKAVNLAERAVRHERFLVAVFYVDDKNILHQEHQPGDFLYGDMPTAIRLLRESLSEKIRLREDRERRELGMEIPEDDEEDVDERLAEPSE